MGVKPFLCILELSGKVCDAVESAAEALALLLLAVSNRCSSALYGMSEVNFG